MDWTRRMIGLALVIVFAVAGSGWALERAFSKAHARGAAPVVEPASAPLTPSAKPAATNDVEYDRSDLILSQG